MTQAWTKSGKRIPVTIVTAAPMTVTQLKSSDSDKYDGVQVGLGTKKAALITKPLAQHLKKSKINPKHIREIRLNQPSDPELNIGDQIKPEAVFEIGDIVNVSGTTKGRGFAGVMKRWGFKGGPRTHGQSDRARAPGSIGQGTTPGRVYKQKKMAGHYGNATFTVKDLQIVNILSEKNEIWINGPIPGGINGLIKISTTRKGTFEGLRQDLEPTPIETDKKEEVIEEEVKVAAAQEEPKETNTTETKPEEVAASTDTKAETAETK